MAESQTNGDSGVEERRKALLKLKRDEADAEARGVGIEDPDALDNIEAVADAIIEAEAKAAAEAEDATADAEQNPRFTRDEVLNNARAITGYRRHLVAGALAGTDQKAFTKKSATKLVADFVDKKDDTRQEAVA